MALWIFKAAVVPREVVGDSRRLSESQFDDLYPKFWITRDGEEAARDLQSLLPALGSWSAQMSVTGRKESDRVEVWRENGRVTCVTLKIDCRTPNAEFVDAVEALAVRHDLLFIYERTFEMCEPGGGALRRFVSSSANRRALGDPESWLPHLTSEVKKREDKG